MSLTISVNVLADLKVHDHEGYERLTSSLQAVNKLLQQNSLPPHNEPETVFKKTFRPHLSSFPSLWLHHLRRAIAYQINREPLTPATGDLAQDWILNEEYYMLRSHIVCHSDAKGFYLPIDFADPMFDTDAIKVPGEIVGSSFAVKQELVSVAESIGIRLRDGELDDAEAQRIASEPEHRNDFWIERQVWLTLYENSLFSLAHKAAIVFQ